MASNDEKQVIIDLLINNLHAKSVSDVIVSNHIIEKILFNLDPTGEIQIKRLNTEDAPDLFDFYLNGLSAQSKLFFGTPYPLFIQPLNSAQELADRINAWKNEKDWTVLLMFIGNKLAGISLLKRYKSGHPVTGIAIRDNYQKKGLGIIMQTLINEQARLLGIKKLWAGAAQDNPASLRLHERCGFRKTGILVPSFKLEGTEKKIARYDVDMIREFD